VLAGYAARPFARAGCVARRPLRDRDRPKLARLPTSLTVSPNSAPDRDLAITENPCARAGYLTVASAAANMQLGAESPPPRGQNRPR